MTPEIKPFAKSLMFYIYMFIGLLVAREIIMVVLVALGKQVFQKSFADYPWYERLLVFLTEFIPVIIIIYGLYIQEKISRASIRKDSESTLNKSKSSGVETVESRDNFVQINLSERFIEKENDEREEVTNSKHRPESI